MSDLTGPIIVEDVVYETINNDDANKGHKYRRLIFQRAESLVQSEALLSTKGSGEIVKETKQEARMFGESHSIHLQVDAFFH